ncbi:probable protein phosphatase 2C 34 isoform X2 [Cicer arietinum]|uniref:Probable protein phosphatase 2C 34 isoform X2 n=1 Tax=Cicer arietinum TaxID=3827 RepID=A0A1S3EC78_CICAR|nr:probable protein phosphatase 2C 34 isoform X2 [Cicer arietinum]
MVHFPSFVNGLAKTVSNKKEKNFPKDDARKAIEELAKEARKNELLLKSSGVVKSNKDNGFVSVFTNRGQKGVNQDCLMVWEEFGGQQDMMFCGVYDGHGAWGHFVAKRVRKLVPAFLLCNWKENVAGTSINLDFKMEADKNIHGLDLWKQSYIKTYAAVDQDLKQHTGFDSFRSGTTALTIIKQGENLIIANVGDSRVVLATTSEDGTLFPLQLTTDFKPNLPKEAERIEQSKGRVFCMKDEPGVYRVWMPNDVTHTKLTTRDQFIILATDGVWDVVSNQEAVKIVSTTPHKEKAGQRLVKYAMREWKRKKSGIAMDDMSAICLFFHTKLVVD